MWLIDWPITAWTWARNAASDVRPELSSSEPFALVERGPRGLVLAGLNPAARALGLRLGQAQADACAMAPALRSEPVEPGQAGTALRHLALWAQRYAPLVACDEGAAGMEGLWLDTTAADHLFGGEAAMLADLTTRLGRAGARVRVGLAGTPGAAWALARFGHPKDPAIAPPGGEAEALATLPMAALRLSPAALQLLGRFGLRHIGALYGLPRAALARRFRGEAGMQVVQRLDQALGRLSEPLLGESAPSPPVAHRIFAEPILHAEGVAHWGALLAHELCIGLDSAGLGARCLLLVGFRVDGRTTSFSAALSIPSRNPEHLIRLLRERGWERLDVGFGLDALRLCAPVTEPLAMSQTDGLDGTGVEDAGRARAALIDRLTARLGSKAVLRPVFRESWLPERAERLAPHAAAGGGATPSPRCPARDRPILLLTPPEPIETMAEWPDGAPARFTWRRVARRVARASGPERLSPEWWRGGGSDARPSRTRDYYRIEDETGGRYWVFRAGLYGVEDHERPPAWWMHGLFP